MSQAMRAGKLLRFEEITRWPPEIQDVLISLMSEKQLMIPELALVQHDASTATQNGGYALYECTEAELTLGLQLQGQLQTRLRRDALQRWLA